MESRINLQDWSLIQSFLAVAETGSLTAAARRLARSQPTLGRHIQTLEATLGTQLFNRHAKGLRLTDTGAKLVPQARQMAQAMHAMALTVAGQSEDLAGTVRLTASVFASHYLLPPILARIRVAEPDIQLELVPSDQSENLLFREADIAVRMYRPTQLDIVARHISNIQLGVFAATSYLARRGRPGTVQDLRDHDLIGYDSDDTIVRSMLALGYPARRTDFQVRCDNQSAYWQLLRAGCGVGFSQLQLGLSDPLVEHLDLGIDLPQMELWLAAPHAMRHTPRLRRVWDLLASQLETARL